MDGVAVVIVTRSAARLERDARYSSIVCTTIRYISTYSTYYVVHHQPTLRAHRPALGLATAVALCVLCCVDGLRVTEKGASYFGLFFLVCRCRCLVPKIEKRSAGDVITTCLAAPSRVCADVHAVLAPGLADRALDVCFTLLYPCSLRGSAVQPTGSCSRCAHT